MKALDPPPAQVHDGVDVAPFGRIKGGGGVLGRRSSMSSVGLANQAVERPVDERYLAMGALQIRALGPLEVFADAESVALGSGKLRIVLECLALRANTVVAADFLAETVWGGTPPAHPGAQLQVYIANLRHLLEPNKPKGAPSQRLISRAAGYLLAIADDELDLRQFREHVAAGGQAVEAGDLPGGAERLRQGVELFRGPAFADLAEIELLAPDLDELEEARLDAYQDLADVELALGRHGSLVGELQQLVAQHPYRERLRASLILALYRTGRQADALAACRQARRTFVEDLGIEPGIQLRELEALVLRQDASLAAPATSGHRWIRQRLDNLPAELTPLVGREAELGEVCSLYGAEGCRLVTVTGPGGTGKTRLALAAAAHLSERMADGVGWVNLAPLTEVQQVPGAIASTLGLDERAGEDPLKAASRFLRTRRFLLVLDNCEHLEEAWPVVLDMLTAAPDLRILTTSRRRLGLRAEHVYELAPLALPPLDPPLPPPLLREVPAVKLLLNRGRAVRSHFGIDQTNASVLTRLCHRLDGLPLAIELAAAQLRHRSEQDLLADLELSLASLPPAFRDLPDRQRTLSATIAWSYELLGTAERLLFDQLGVFTGDPTAPAIGAVCTVTSGQPEIGDLISTLVGHSLLRRYTDSAGRTRVSMLHSIREFARERLTLLNDEREVRNRHADYYLHLAENVGPQLWGRDQVHAFRTLQAEALDLRAALLWAAGPEGSTELALRLVGELWHFWQLTEDVTELREIARQLVEQVDAPSNLLAPALSGTATFCWMTGRNEEAKHLHQRALEAFRAAGDGEGVAWSLSCLAVQAMQKDELVLGQQLAEAAIQSPHASPRTKAAALTNLGLTRLYAGDCARAASLCRQGVDNARALGDRWLLGIALVNLADSLREYGDLDASEQFLIEALGTAVELGAQTNGATFLESLADVYLEKGRIGHAIRVLAAVEAYRTDRGLVLSAPEHRRVDEIIGRARSLAGPVPFGLAWASGQSLTLSQIVQEVLVSPYSPSRP